MPLKTIVAVAVPLEAELVDRIRAVDPSVTVLYDPELLTGLPPGTVSEETDGLPPFRPG